MYSQFLIFLKAPYSISVSIPCVNFNGWPYLDAKKAGNCNLFLGAHVQLKTYGLENFFKCHHFFLSKLLCLNRRLGIQTIILLLEKKEKMDIDRQYKHKPGIHQFSVFLLPRVTHCLCLAILKHLMSQFEAVSLNKSSLTAPPHPIQYSYSYPIRFPNQYFLIDFIF